MSEPTPLHIGLGTRLWFAYACFFKVLFDALFADRAWALYEGAPAPAPALAPAPSHAPTLDAALQLLALFQREGRLVDFLEEDVTAFPDADVGAAARVVHDGCRKALREHASLKPVREEAEGATVTVEAATPAAHVKLLGNVSGSAPFRGVLRHRGWRIDDLQLPTAIGDHDLRIVAPAEVEL